MRPVTKVSWLLGSKSSLWLIAAAIPLAKTSLRPLLGHRSFCKASKSCVIRMILLYRYLLANEFMNVPQFCCFFCIAKRKRSTA